jgi:chorismate-pyruvate lyase
VGTRIGNVVRVKQRVRDVMNLGRCLHAKSTQTRREEVGVNVTDDMPHDEQDGDARTRRGRTVALPADEYEHDLHSRGRLRILR